MDGALRAPDIRPEAAGSRSSKTLVSHADGFGRVQGSPLRELVPAAMRSALTRNCDWMPPGSSGFRDAPRGARLYGSPHLVGSAVEGVSLERRQNERQASWLSQLKGAEGHAGLVETRVALQLVYREGSCRGEKPRHPGVTHARREPRYTRRSHSPMMRCPTGSNLWGTAGTAVIERPPPR